MRHPNRLQDEKRPISTAHPRKILKHRERSGAVVVEHLAVRLAPHLEPNLHRLELLPIRHRLARCFFEVELTHQLVVRDHFGILPGIFSGPAPRLATALAFSIAAAPGAACVICCCFACSAAASLAACTSSGVFSHRSGTPRMRATSGKARSRLKSCPGSCGC